jgi:hypothetical protein
MFLKVFGYFDGEFIVVALEMGAFNVDVYCGCSGTTTNP